jgi:hypothetical protein
VGRSSSLVRTLALRSGQVALGQHETTSDHSTQVEIAIEWNLYENWVRSKYAKSYAKTIMCYSRKYFILLNDVKQIDLLKAIIRNNVINDPVQILMSVVIHKPHKKGKIGS